jgi:predicted PurR-regulated permease PerM
VVAVIAFTSLFGIVGALIAVPVTKSIEILIGAAREGRQTAVLEPPLPEPEPGTDAA